MAIPPISNLLLCQRSRTADKFAASVSNPRAFHKAALLTNGKVLVAGGYQKYRPRGTNRAICARRKYEYVGRCLRIRCKRTDEKGNKKHPPESFRWNSPFRFMKQNPSPWPRAERGRLAAEHPDVARAKMPTPVWCGHFAFVQFTAE